MQGRRKQWRIESLHVVERLRAVLAVLDELSTRSIWEKPQSYQCGVAKEHMPQVPGTSIRLLTLDLFLGERRNTGNSRYAGSEEAVADRIPPRCGKTSRCDQPASVAHT
jgi:hypothetical protein